MNDRICSDHYGLHSQIRHGPIDARSTGPHGQHGLSFEIPMTDRIGIAIVIITKSSKTTCFTIVGCKMCSNDLSLHFLYNKNVNYIHY